MTEREQFEAWLKKDWPQLTIDFAPLMGFYKGDDGAQIGNMWDGWQASRRAALEEIAERFDAIEKQLNGLPITPGFAARQVRTLSTGDTNNG